MGYTIGYTTIPRPKVCTDPKTDTTYVVHVLPNIRSTDEDKQYRVYFIAPGVREGEIFWLSVCTDNPHDDTIEMHRRTFLAEYASYLSDATPPYGQSKVEFVPDPSFPTISRGRT